MSPEKLHVIALISGGKDSFYSIAQCLSNGHDVVALANLYPPPPENGGTDREGQDVDDDDMNSFMYQTVGHTVIPLYEDALGIPLYRQQITGGAANTDKTYNFESSSSEDETEALIPLLTRVIAAHPTANAVCTGAILSSYQRTRVESVALRLKLVPLSYLWQYPFLPPGRPESLLEDMAAFGQDSRIIKVASGGLDESFLWENVASVRGRGRIKKAVERFGGSDDGAVLGEGGEFETLALDGPTSIWKGKIEVEEGDRVIVRQGGGSAYLRIKGARVVMKEGEEIENTVRVPDLLDGAFSELLQSSEARIDPGGSKEKELSPKNSKYLSIPAWKVSQGIDTLFINNMIADTPATSSVASAIDQICTRLTILLSNYEQTPDSILHTTILLRSMDDFAIINEGYSRLFNLPSPPARLTVALGDALPESIPLSISITAYMHPRDSRRNALHVQSRSYWAPANIGPYSQAISVPVAQLPSYHMPSEGYSVSESPQLVYLAGQIPLVPASMELVSSDLPQGQKASFVLDVTLALQHLWRVGKAMKVDSWTGGVAFIAEEEEVHDRLSTGAKAKIAWEIWVAANERNDAKDEEEEEQEEFDVWHTQHNALNEFDHGKSSATDTSGNHHDISSVPVPFIAAVVSSLPRSASVEWSSMGIKSSSNTSPTWSSGRIPQNSTSHLRSGFSDPITCTIKDSVSITYATMKCNEKYSDVAAYMQEALTTNGFMNSEENDGTWRLVNALIYIDISSDVKGDYLGAYADRVVVVPCKSVWGSAGEQVLAGMILRSERVR
jgi:diphthine-ammonia ligase